MNRTCGCREAFCQHTVPEQLSREDLVKFYKDRIRIMERENTDGCRRLGKKYGVDKKTIQRIRRGIHWKKIIVKNAAPTKPE